jgi:hypothetical protein
MIAIELTDDEMLDVWQAHLHSDHETAYRELGAAVGRIVTAAKSAALREGVRLAAYETGWWCGECNPAIDEGCCALPDRVRAAL